MSNNFRFYFFHNHVISLFSPYFETDPQTICGSGIGHTSQYGGEEIFTAWAVNISFPPYWDV